MKAVKPEKLLALIDEKLGEQSKAEKITEEKVAEWVKTRVRQLEPERHK